MTVRELREILEQVENQDLEVRLGYYFFDERDERWEDDSPIDAIEYFHHNGEPSAVCLYAE